MTVSTNSGLYSLGGATGNVAKITNPIRPEMIIAFRSSTYSSRFTTINQIKVATSTGQCIQMYTQFASVTTRSEAIRARCSCCSMASPMLRSRSSTNSALRSAVATSPSVRPRTPK